MQKTTFTSCFFTFALLAAMLPVVNAFQCGGMASFNRQTFGGIRKISSDKSLLLRVKK